ncbi:hypothetical protein, partial [Sinorhizobium meliloti]|uniref:hypothetical protein n=1 Tax=Rhizobium meliloti TaxID=382 RepID=UPI001AECF845
MGIGKDVGKDFVHERRTRSVTRPLGEDLTAEERDGAASRFIPLDKGRSSFYCAGALCGCAGVAGAAGAAGVSGAAGVWVSGAAGAVVPPAGGVAWSVG